MVASPNIAGRQFHRGPQMDLRFGWAAETVQDNAGRHMGSRIHRFHSVGLDRVLKSGSQITSHAQLFGESQSDFGARRQQLRGTTKRTYCRGGVLLLSEGKAQEEEPSRIGSGFGQPNQLSDAFLESALARQGSDQHHLGLSAVWVQPHRLPRKLLCILVAPEYEGCEPQCGPVFRCLRPELLRLVRVGRRFLLLARA